MDDKSACGTAAAPANVEQAFRGLLCAASLAPSGDNTQPWQFAVVGGGRTVELRVDESRDHSPMNAGQRMARLAVGAAAENIAVCAQHNGSSVEITAGANTDALHIQLDTLSDEQGSLPTAIASRVTNRRLYDGRRIDPAEVTELEKAVVGDRVRLIWMVQRNQLDSLAAVIGKADATMFGMRSVRTAFLENVRFDRPATETVEVGLSLGSLELAPGERMGMGMMGAVPNALYGVLGIGRALQKKAKALVESASGLCIVVAEDDEPLTDLAVGRRMQQAWLALTQRGYAVQPMMSVPVLENIVRNGPPGLADRIAKPTGELGEEIKHLIGVGGTTRIAAILRFGFAPPPTARTGRRPLESMLHTVARSG